MHLLDSQEEQPELLAGLDTFLGTFWLSKIFHSFLCLLMYRRFLSWVFLSNLDFIVAVRAFPVIGWLAINLPQSLTRKLIPGFKSLRDVNTFHFPFLSLFSKH